MTVSSETNKSGPYACNGSTVSFPFNFRILDPTHIEVIKTIDGVDTTVSPTAYSVTGVGNANGGTVVFNAAPASGRTVTIIRNVPFTQSLDLENQGAFYAQTIEDALDLAVMRDQELAEALSRTMKVPAGTDAEISPDFMPAVIHFAKVWLGAFDNDPTTGFDGGALTGGEMYFNAAAKEYRVFDGSKWTFHTGPTQVDTYFFTAVGAQTAFFGSDDAGADVSVVSGAVIVSINGIGPLREGVDFTVRSGGDGISLATAAANGDEVQITSFRQMQFSQLGEITEANAVRAEAAADRAESALAEVVQMFSFSSLAALKLTAENYVAGTIVSTRKEGYVYIVVSASPDVTCASGMKLQVQPQDGRWSFGALEPAGDGVTDDRAKFVRADAIGGQMYLPAPAVKYKLSSSLNLSTVSVRPSRSVDWAALTGDGMLTWAGGSRTDLGAKVERIADRLFVGRAAYAYAGKPGSGGTGDAGSSDFSDTAKSVAYVPTQGQIVVEAGPNSYAIAAVAQASQAIGTGCIGLGVSILNDEAENRSWGGIVEGILKTGDTLNGWEISLMDASGVSRSWRPYQESYGSFGVRFGAGGATSGGSGPTAPCTAGMIFQKHVGHTVDYGWNTGIAFANDALTGCDGTTGEGEALAMAKGHCLRWYAPSGTADLGAQIKSDVTSAAGYSALHFIDNAIITKGVGGANGPRLSVSSGDVNYPVLASAAAGAPVVVSASGADTDISLKLVPKGAGKVQFGTHVANGDAAITGYIQIRDASGVLRKLAVIS